MSWLPVPSTPATGPVLRDIHLPPAPSWWPPAPGWWLLAALLVALLFIALAWWRGQLRARRQRQRVLAEVDHLLRQHAGDHDQAALASGLHQLLRRAARQHVVQAGWQRGGAWRETLSRMPVDTATVDQLEALEAMIYRPASTVDQDAMANATRRWLRLALKPAVWKRSAAGQSRA